MFARIMAMLFMALLLVPAASFTAGGAETNKPDTSSAKEFQQLHTEMNDLLAKLAELQVKYRTASEEQRTEIQRQWKELIAKGEALEPRLIEAAEAAYEEAPNADPKLTAFLVKLLAQQIRSDRFEAAAKLGKLLMEHDCKEKGVANLAGIAAFATHDFAAAEQYFTIAKESGYYETAKENDQTAQIGRFYAEAAPRYKELWQKEAALRQAEAKADDLPRVLLKTTKGDIVLELFENEAPNTVANFISLVEKGFYDGLTFHRVIGGFMAQGGCPKGDGSGRPGYSIACECYKPNHRLHFRGSLSMAHAGRDTGGSQFFLTFVPAPHLDGKHTVFGRVIEGMDVLAKLQRRNPEDPEAPRPDKILQAKVLRKRPHPYVPQKMPE